jgi:hypothetical protein
MGGHLITPGSDNQTPTSEKTKKKLRWISQNANRSTGLPKQEERLQILLQNWGERTGDPTNNNVDMTGLGLSTFIHFLAHAQYLLKIIKCMLSVSLILLSVCSM